MASTTHVELGGAQAPWFDPGWLIHRTLSEAPADASAAAEEALLAWLLRLPAERDPAVAAGEVLRAYRPPRRAAAPVARRLFALLEETQDYDAERLARLYPARRRQRPARWSQRPAV